MKSIPGLSIGAVVFSAALLAGVSASGQKTTFVSPIDESLTVKSIVFCPIVDNVKEIYSTPATEHVRVNLESGRRWKILYCPEQVRATLEEYEEKPERVKAALQATQADALITGRVSRGPSGLGVRIGLFIGSEGLPWTVVSTVESNMFELSDVKKTVKSQLDKVLATMPYEALVASRRGQLVTIDRGSEHGLFTGEEIQVIQITQIRRHPKFNFVVGVEKAIMGTVKLQKVEETLSFGTVTSERSEGLIAPGFKAVSEKFVRYAETPLSGDGRLQEPLGQRPDRDLSLGAQPEEWVPPSADEPAFGAVSMLFGLGTYEVANSLATSGGVSGSNSLSPSLHLGAEIWVTAKWILLFDIHQTVAKISNDMPNSGPGNLNIQTRELQLAGAYRVWFGEGLMSPILDVSLGMNQMNGYVDDSTPTAFTSVNYGGLYLGLAGAFPVDLSDRKMMLGARFNYVLNASLSESPTTSGSDSSSSVSQFSVFTKYPWRPRLNWMGELRFHQYGSTLRGAGSRAESASSVSHSMTALAMGIEFLF